MARRRPLVFYKKTINTDAINHNASSIDVLYNATKQPGFMKKILEMQAKIYRKYEDVGESEAQAPDKGDVAGE